MELLYRIPFAVLEVRAIVRYGSFIGLMLVWVVRHHLVGVHL